MVVICKMQIADYRGVGDLSCHAGDMDAYFQREAIMFGFFFFNLCRNFCVFFHPQKFKEKGKGNAQQSKTQKNNITKENFKYIKNIFSHKRLV